MSKSVIKEETRTVQIRLWGNSLIMTITKELSKLLNLVDKDWIRVTLRKIDKEDAPNGN